MRSRSLILRQACSAVLLAGALVAGSAGAQSTTSQIGNPKANTTSTTPSSSSSSSTTGSRTGNSSDTTRSDSTDMGTNDSSSTMSNGTYDSSGNTTRSSTSSGNMNDSSRSSTSATGATASGSSSMNSTGRTHLSQRDTASSSSHKDKDKNKNKSSSQGGFTREDSSQTASGTAPTTRDPATKGAKNDSWATGAISNRTPTAAGTGDGDTSPTKPDAGIHERDQSVSGPEDRNHDGISGKDDDSSNR